MTRRNHGKPYTLDELRVIESMAPTHTPAQIAEVLVGRTPKSISIQGTLRGIRFKDWQPRRDHPWRRAWKPAATVQGS